MEALQPTLTKHSMLTSPKRCIIDIFAAISLNGIGLFCVRVHVREKHSEWEASFVWRNRMNGLLF